MMERSGKGGEERGERREERVFSHNSSMTQG
jgi:hypothetical protein